MTRSAHAVVSLPALDLRPVPDHRAELGSQLLVGETVRVLPAKPCKGWWRVRNTADGYEGWVREWGLVPASSTRVARWRALARAVVTTPACTAFAGPEGGIAVSPLFLGGRVIPGRRRGGSRAVELPDGRRGWVPESALLLPGAPAPSLLDRVTSLLGSPYLWGGRTPAGIDCSAFSQLVLAEQGHALPRDAADQFGACVPVPEGGPVLPGDLAFFALPGELPSHVGVALGEGYFAHSRGMVCIASLEPGNRLQDKALTVQFRGWFRPRKGARRPRRPPVN
jgi:cell wall-associated NlpC family hydrolase